MVDKHKLELNRSMNCCRVALNETKFFSYVICQQSIMVKKWIEKKPSISDNFQIFKKCSTRQVDGKEGQKECSGKLLLKLRKLIERICQGKIAETTIIMQIIRNERTKQRCSKRAGLHRLKPNFSHEVSKKEERA